MTYKFTNIVFSTVCIIYNVKDSLIKIDSVQNVRINLEKKNAVVDGDYNSEAAKEAIAKTGYKVVE